MFHNSVNVAGTGPALREKTAPLPRRARALGCHTRIRAGCPRHAAIAGDRPPRYGKKRPPSRRARACPSPCVWLSDRVTPIGQEHLLLTRSGAGTPELQRWAQCLPVGGTSRSRLLLVGQTNEPRYTQLNHRAELDMSAANGYTRCL